MKKILILLTLLLLFFVNYSKSQNFFESSLLVMPVENHQHFTELKNDSDFVSMFFFYQEEGCEKCNYVAELIK